MTLDQITFEKVKEHPPIITKPEFLHTLSVHGYDVDLARKGLILANSIHNHNEGHMYNYGRRNLSYDEVFNLNEIIIAEDNSIRGASYAVGHLMPVTLCYLDHALRNNQRPSNEDLMAMILHDALEDLHWNSPYFQPFKNKGMYLDDVVEKDLRNDIEEITSDSFYIVDSLTKKPGNLYGDVEKLEHLASINPNLVNYKFADRLIGTRATMHQNKPKESLEKFPLRRSLNFLKFAYQNPEFVWPSFTKEFEEEIKILQEIIQ